MTYTKAMTYRQIYDYVVCAALTLAKTEGLSPQFQLAHKTTLKAQGRCNSTGRIELTVHRSIECEERVKIIRTAQTACHEIAHLKHMNHGPEFWRYQEHLCNEMSKLLGMKVQPERSIIR